MSIKRERFNLLCADWSGLKTALANVDWSPMQRDTADAAASFCHRNALDEFVHLHSVRTDRNPEEIASLVKLEMQNSHSS